MPSAAWKLKHQQINFWLTKDEYLAFKALCRENHITVAEVFRQVVASQIARKKS